MIPADIARAIRDRDRVAMARPHPTTAQLDRHDLIAEVDRLNREVDRLNRENTATTGFDLAEHITRQAAWSARTFGPGTRPAGIVDHIRKELDEITADPADLAEWVDVIILAIDGATRQGHTGPAVVTALVGKQARNEARRWPDWRTADRDKAIEHIRDEATP